MKRPLFLIAFCFLSLGIFSQAPVKKVIVEKFTSVSCGNCAYGSYTLNNLLSNEPNAIGVAHHVSATFDPMYNQEAWDLFDYYSFGTPTATVNRSGMAGSMGSWDNEISNELAVPAPVFIFLENLSYDENTKTLTVDIRAQGYNSISGDLRLGCMVTENNVTGGRRYNQGNYYNNTQGHPLYGAGHPIQGFVHDHVQRAMLGGIWGKSTGTSSLSSGQSISETFTYTLADTFDPYKIHLVGYLAAYGPGLSDRKILNAEETELKLVLSRESSSLDVTIYPNPSFDQIKIQGLQIETSYSILDLEGRTITQGMFSGSQNLFSLDISKLETGIYILRLENERGNQISKIIVGQ